MKHPYADLIMEYAKIAQHDDKPWELFEVTYDFCNWVECIQEIKFLPIFGYRLKPRTININGFEVPEPLRVAPEVGEECYLVETPYVNKHQYIGHDIDNKMLKSGLLHLTKENAEKHVEALLSFTKKVQ